MKKILTLTMNPAIDVNTGIEHVVPERKLRCRLPRRVAGGGGINVSRPIRKLGGNAIVLYTAGGPRGEIPKKMLSDEQQVAATTALVNTGKVKVVVLPLHDAIRLGVAAGSAAVMTPGTELCRLEDAERLYRQRKQERRPSGG